MTQPPIPLLLYLGAPPSHWPVDLAAHIAADRLRISAASDIYSLAANLLAAPQPVAALLIDPHNLRPREAHALQSLHTSTAVPLFLLQPPSAALARLLPAARLWTSGNMENLGDMHKNGDAAPAAALDADPPSRYDDSEHVMLTSEEVRALLGSAD